MTEVVTNFGQKLTVGDTVGWGHRNGNMSAQQVGVVLELKPFETRRGFEETVRHRAKCRWVGGNVYTSTTEAETLFVLDPDTLSGVLQEGLVEARKQAGL